MKRILAWAEWVRAQYQVIILATVVAALGLGLSTTAPGKVLQSSSQAITFLMIFFISLTITPRQFAQVTRQYRPVLIGLLLNFGYMPLVCWALARGWWATRSSRPGSSWWASCRARAWRRCGPRC